MTQGPIITLHAKDRAKERLGLNATALSRMAEKALNEGVGHAQTKGRLNRYISGLYMAHKKADNTRIYGEHVYLFCGNYLLTILHLPHKMRRAARDAMVRGKA